MLGNNQNSEHYFSFASNVSSEVMHATWYDAFFPLFAFVMVIIVPSCVVMWVVYRTIFDQSKSKSDS